MSEVWIPKATVTYIPLSHKTRREVVQMSRAVQFKMQVFFFFFFFFLSRLFQPVE